MQLAHFQNVGRESAEPAWNTHVFPLYMSTASLRRDPRSSRRGRGRGASTFPSTKISARNENLQTVALNAQWSGKTSRGSPKPRRGGINRNKGFGNSSPSKVTLRKEENGLDLSESGFMTAAQRAKRFGATNKSMLYDQVRFRGNYPCGNPFTSLTTSVLTAERSTRS